MKIVIALIVFAILVVAGSLLIYSGVYNFSATEPRTGLARWVFDTITEHSVRSHAKGIMVPPLSDESLVQKGFHRYQETCVKCHGAPGVSPSKMAKGLNPRPPDLAEKAHQWTPAELYWIAKNGIKRSGMPAFGPKHSEEDLWAIAAFVKRLPDLSPEDYQAMKEAAEGK